MFQLGDSQLFNKMLIIPCWSPTTRSPLLFLATTRPRREDQAQRSSYHRRTLSFSPSCRPSRPVVPGCLGHRALHRRLQTHGKLPLLLKPRHDGHCFYLGNGPFLCRSTSLRLVQVSGRMLSGSPGCCANSTARQEMHSWLRREDPWAPGKKGRTEMGPQLSAPRWLSIL